MLKNAGLLEEVIFFIKRIISNFFFKKSIQLKVPGWYHLRNNNLSRKRRDYRELIWTSLSQN